MKRTIETDDFESEESDELSDDLGDEGDDVEECADDNEDGDAHEPPAKMAKLDATLFKPPTAQELNNLKEAESLFQSNLFKLQITELLTEISLKEKRRQQIEATIEKMKTVLTSLPKGDSHQLQDQKWLKKSKVSVPFLQIPRVCKGEFHFQAPQTVELVGSFAVGTCIKPDVHVDLLVEMPKECIQAKDYLNQRYLRKRALYLAVIAGHLQKKSFVDELKFTYHHGNHLKPILIIHAKGESGRTTEVHLHVGLPPGVFKLNRFMVDKNNVRRHWFHGKEESTEGEGEEMSATPVYNNSVLQDLLQGDHKGHLLQAQTDTLGIREGIMLLKVWLRQRELDKGYGCFSGFIMSMYVVYLLNCRKLHRLMSSYQVMRNTLVSLASTDWISNPPSMCIEQSDPQLPPLDLFQEHCDVVFVDPSGYLNLCSSLTQAIYKRVKHEANLAIKFLESSDLGAFETLLLKPVPFVRKFDQMFHISSAEALKGMVDKLECGNSLLDQGGHHVHACMSALVRLIDGALGDRVHLIQPALSTPAQWIVGETPPGLEESTTLTFGLLLNQETANSIIEKGPPAQDPEAAEFREMWGDKSELRRFQDSSIHEAVVWTNSTLVCRRRLICAKVVKHILNRHAAIPASQIHFIGSQLDPLLHLPKPKGDNSVYGTGEEEHMAVIQSLDQLSKLLHKLDDLPLTVKTVQGVAPVFRFSEVFPAMPAIPRNIQTTNASAGSEFLPHPDKPAPFYLPSLKVMCKLEGSGKWPDDLEAIRRLKAAFYIQLSFAVRKKDPSLFVRVAPTHLDVLKDGFVFRVVIGHMREITLAKMSTSVEGVVQSKDTEESKLLQREYSGRPKLTSTLHGIQQQHNTYSGAVRLAKRWVASHMMLDHLAEEAVELLVASVYIHPAPYTVPGSPVVGFLRFLTLLSAHDWKAQPLIINLNNEFTKDEISELHNRFTSERSSFPLLSVCTKQDPVSSHWTRDSPTAPLLQRVVLLARESRQVLEAQILTDFMDADFKTIFRPPLDAFDLIINLKNRQLPRQHQAVDISMTTKIPARESESTWRKLMPVLDYDPVQFYLQELRGAFDEVALFFYDKFGGSFIGVVWKPRAGEVRDFKVSEVGGCMLDTENVQCDDVSLKVNLEAIISDFEIMGKGLVANIKTLEK